MATLARLQTERIDRVISHKKITQTINVKQFQLAKLDSMPSLTMLNRCAREPELEIGVKLESKEAAVNKVQERACLEDVFI
ncbi:hypothetical protein [Pediococcus ethanolidurans]|nr:hypothetical protein [Pediococcus ethanolidurans]KRN83554.1 hypothetical protein IV87_GL000023 [Pediococcus ethanolidurans]GEN94091.1 hypothetical protein PET01_01410 [Pediococcus ethanolidurans]